MSLIFGEMRKGQQVHNFSLPDLVDGIYFYSIFQKQQKVFTGKVIITQP